MSTAETRSNHGNESIEQTDNAGSIAPILLLLAEKPNRKWVTDVREFSPLGGKRYLPPILHPPQNQGKAKGLAACHSQTASPLSCSKNFY
ncbi:MAG: hypothetical protein EGQ75_08395 [Clostridiales bacterium]|nr:hypothetical protein [Clostridiales bacterium]